MATHRGPAGSPGTAPAPQADEVARLREQVWSWLPAFHAVAELGTAVQAGRHLGVTAAAVSRSVRLLEDRLAQPLFHRVGRSLVLNEAGLRLREATREAMQALDEGLRGVDPSSLARPLRVASLGLLTEHFVVPALLELSVEREDVCPEHLNLRPVEALAMLRRFAVDAAFYYEELVAEGIAVTELGATPKSVFCGREHPLFDAPDPSLEAILAHPFSVPQVGDSGRPMDGWPSRLARRVGMRVTMLRSNLQVSLSGRFLTVLPDVTASPHLQAGELRRLPRPALDPIRVFVARRAEEVDRPDLRAVIARVTGALGDGGVRTV
ncbi:MAG: LysR family transcriptional regulator [Sandaracinaceae bacterium]